MWERGRPPPRKEPEGGGEPLLSTLHARKLSRSSITLTQIPTTPRSHPPRRYIDPRAVTECTGRTLEVSDIGSPGKERTRSSVKSTHQRCPSNPSTSPVPVGSTNSHTKRPKFDSLVSSHVLTALAAFHLPQNFEAPCLVRSVISIVITFGRSCADNKHCDVHLRSLFHYDLSR